MKTSNSPYLISFFVLLFSANTYATGVNFIIDNYDAIKHMAQVKEKPFFVDFYGEWCPSCQVMDETTFQDEQVVTFVEQNYIAVKCDINTPIGESWKNQFGVNCIPTIMMFDQNGELQERYEAPLTGSAFLHELKMNHPNFKAYANAHRTKQNHSVAAITSSFSPTGLVQRSAEFEVAYSPQQSNITTKSKNVDDIINDPNFINTLKQHRQMLLNLMIENGLSANQNSSSNANTIQASELVELEKLSHEISTIQHVNNNQSYEESCRELLANPERLKQLIQDLELMEKYITQAKTNIAVSPVPSNNHSNVQKTVVRKEVVSTPVKASYVPTVSISKTDKSKNYELSHYKIQVGVYNEYNNMVKMITKLKDRFYFPVYTSSKTINGKEQFTVFLGEFKTRQDALKAKNTLKQNGFRGIIKAR